MEVKDVYIASSVRTPIGTFRSSFIRVSAMELGTVVVKEVLKRADVPAERIEEVLVGCVLTAGLGQNVARQIALSSGMPKSAQCTTVNKVCSSSLKAITLAALSIHSGYRNYVLTAGTESMSNAPFYLPRGEVTFGNTQLIDGMQRDGLTDALVKQPMGLCAEKTVKDYGVTREEQDAYAIESYRRAEKAWQDGLYKAEVVPVSVPVNKGEPKLIEEDEEYKRLIPLKVPNLKPAFLNDGSGTITAANASSINDGAAAVLVVSKKAIDNDHVKPVAQILAIAEDGLDPVDFTAAPARAVQRLLAATKLDVGSIALWEINEAFSVTPIVFMRDLKLDPKRVNIRGGAVALGHPIGASGSRIVVTLLHALQPQELGIAVICNGGGEATAILVKKLH